MKPITFLGDSLNRLRDFSEDIRQDAGYQLDKIQRGYQPDDFKPMPIRAGGRRTPAIGRYRRLPGDLFVVAQT